MLTKKINVIIQARMGSTRLPGKVLKPILGKPLLSILTDRLRKISQPHKLIIAMTTNPLDDPLESFAKRENILFFRGSEKDVLDRYYQTCLEYPADLIIRLTSDCPLLDPEVINQAINEFEKNEMPLDYVSNTIHRTFPRGEDVEAFTFPTLECAAHEAKLPWDREHVTPFIYKHPERFKLVNFTHSPNVSQYRITVDTEEDFLLVSKIFEYLYPKNKNFKLADILGVLEQNPEWLKINAHVKQKNSK